MSYAWCMSFASSMLINIVYLFYFSLKPNAVQELNDTVFNPKPCPYSLASASIAYSLNIHE